MLEQRPEQVPGDDWILLLLLLLDYLVEGGQRWVGDIACPVVFAGDIDAVRTSHGGDVVFQFG